jgi:hypothetical protein
VVISRAPGGPAQLRERFKRSIDRQQLVVYAIASSALEGQSVFAKLDLLVRELVALLEGRDPRGKRSFAISVLREFQNWDNGQKCVCVFIGGGDQTAANSGAGLIAEYLTDHPDYVGMESAGSPDGRSYVVAFYEPAATTLHLSAPALAYFLPNNTNFKSEDDGEWVFMGVREPAEGPWLDDLRTKTGGIFQDADDIREFFGAFYYIQLQRFTATQQARLKRMHAIPEIGRELTWNVINHSLTLTDVDYHLEDLEKRLR